MDFDLIPVSIRNRIQGLSYEENDTGMSGSQVLVFPDRVLKIGPHNGQTDGMVRVMRWLEGRLPAPRVLEFERDQEKEYLLMTRIPGKMACDKSYMEQPETLIPLLGEGLRMFWNADTTGCPRTISLQEQLSKARQRVEAGEADMEWAQPETYGPSGFKDPADLLCWLENNQPPLEPALSHGDFCLPNVFLNGNRISGFIDLGECGIADKWRDAALCWRSLRNNASGRYGGPGYPGIQADRLFDCLGIAPDWEKIRYYILLDELF